MIFWGDIIHVPDIQFYNPDITIKFDVDSTAAAARRKRDFADAAKEPDPRGHAAHVLPGSRPRGEGGQSLSMASSSLRERCETRRQ